MTKNRLLIGVEARCEDGPCGRVRAVVVDPVDKRLMELAVKPDGLHGGHLVPPDLIASVGEEVVLRCTRDEFVRLEPAEETSEQHTASWPYTGEERGGGRFPTGVEGIERDTGYGNRTTIHDRIPEGGVELRRGEPVYATDGEVGRVSGLSIRLPDAHLGHLLLNGGRWFGRKAIAVPIESASSFGDGIRLDLTREEVHALPELAGSGD
jgi:uncharacterized protein YrrD